MLIFLGIAITLHAQTDDAVLSIDTVADMVQIGELRGFDSAVNSLTFTANSQFIIAGGEDTSLRVWDIATQSETQTLFPHNSYIKAVALSPDGTKLATASWDRQVIIYSVADDGFLIQTDTLSGYMSVINQVTFLTDDKIVFSVGDGSLVLVDLSNTSEQTVIEAGALHIIALDVISSPTGSLIAVITGFPDESLWIYDENLQNPRRITSPSTQGRTTVAFSPIVADDSFVLAMAGNNEAVALWDIPASSETELPDAPFNMVSTRDSVLWYTDLAFSPDATLLFTAYIPGTLLIHDVSNPSEERGLLAINHDSGILDIAVSPDGRMIATGHENGIIRLWGIEAE
jgi:WD40 repeat protein